LHTLLHLQPALRSQALELKLGPHSFPLLLDSPTRRDLAAICVRMFAGPSCPTHDGYALEPPPPPPGEDEEEEEEGGFSEQPSLRGEATSMSPPKRASGGRAGAPAAASFGGGGGGSGGGGGGAALPAAHDPDGRTNLGGGPVDDPFGEADQELKKVVYP
jgi:uncharacterized membrane protein YgcG